MNSLCKKGFILTALVSSVTAPLALSASLALPTTPMIAGSLVDPNLMLLLDSSGSMKAIVEQESEDGYDADSTYIACDSGNTIPDGSTVSFHYLNTPNIAYFYVTGISGAMFLGNGGTYNYSGSNYNKKCFATEGTYTASLNTTQSSSGTYSGNFLNWYFQLNTGESYTGGKKSNASTRLEVTQDVAKELVSELSDIRVGLAQFDYDEGADILVDIDDIDTNKTILTSEINSMTASTWTPIAESLQDLGYYFSSDATSNLTVSSASSTYQCAAADIFTPSNATSIKSSKTVIENWCQQNFIVLMTDGEPTKDDDISQNLQDYTVAQADGINVVKAMYETDLRPNLSEVVGTQTVNNVTTYMIGFSSTSATGSSLLSSMAAAGGGGDFLTANTSDELLSAFWSTSESIFSKTASMSSLSFNTSIISSDSTMYMANFQTSSWAGSLYAYDLDTGDMDWSAADKLDALSVSVVSGDNNDIYDRNIFTYNGSTGLVFNYDHFSSFSSAQKNDLYAGTDIDGDGASSDSDDVQTLINYIYGDNSNEGTGTANYRTRSSLIGDIVNSTSVYVGEADLDWPDYNENSKFGLASSDTSANITTSYSNFQKYLLETDTKRTPVVYVGANDGMLHGFNAASGQEVMAYIPETIASTETAAGLHYLANTNYAHQFYVDLTPTVSDIFINSGDGSGSAWHSVLIGGLRAGGKGLFALDVTDPDDFSSSDTNAANLVLWEFSSVDDIDFGYSYSEPQVVMMNNGKWAVITGNGYNSTNERAALFILFIEEGVDGTWTPSTDYIKIYAGASTSNGLSTPTVVDTGTDSVADRIYAGDLQGNMWAFDVSSSIASEWGVAESTSDSASEPLFTATNQPITTAPTIINNTNSTGASPNLLVLFGTGKYLEATDITDSTSRMSYYAVADNSEGGKDKTDLTSRTLLTNNGLRTITGSNINWGSSSGWYFDLVEQANTDDDATVTDYGERVVTESTISGEVLFFNTWIPDGSECSSGGTSWYMSLDMDTGLAVSFAVFDANDDGVIDSSDQGYIGESYSGGLLSSSSFYSSDSRTTTDSDNTTGSNSTQMSGTSGGGTDDRATNNGASGGSEGRLSWEEVYRN